MGLAATQALPRFSVGLASTADEIMAAQQLRYRIFAEEMGANLYNLHLYHTEQKKVKWTRPMSKAYIFDDYILFAEKTESYLVSSAEELSCNSSIGIDKAYFKVYTARYAEEHPIVEFTNQIFCGSSKSTHIATL